jgi:hypothetical protein
MIDKNVQLLERDNKQDTGEEQSKVSIAEDPSRLVHDEVRHGHFTGGVGDRPYKVSCGCLDRRDVS